MSIAEALRARSGCRRRRPRWRAKLALIAPELAFREVLARGGWYRLGGVVDAAGDHIASDIEQWAASGAGRATATISRAGRRLRRQRSARHAPDRQDALLGRRHRQRRRRLHAGRNRGIAGGGLPAAVRRRRGARQHRGSGRCARSLRRQAPLPLGIPFYALRRVTDVAEFLARMRAQKPEPQTVHRFIEAWEKSSAGNAAQFSNHWVLAVREHLDRYRQPILSATPVAAIVGTSPKFEGGFGARGLALRRCLAALRPPGRLSDGLVLPHADHQGRAACRRGRRRRGHAGRLRLPARTRRQGDQGLAPPPYGF